jgi:HD-like signal output (HDOD) protein
MPLEAYETLAQIREGMKMFQFASLAAIVKTAQNLSRQIDTMTNFELAQIISKDPFATAKVLDLANKGGSEKVAVTKLEDAILKAGYAKVRQIAFSLLDMESVKEKLRHPEQEEAASISLVACFVAEELMALKGKYEAEEAYISTVLRGYGKVLMASFLIDTYREAQILIGVKGERSAFRTAFGIAPIDLTYELLLDSKLPKEIVRTLKPIDPNILEAELISLNKTDELIIFAEFATTFTSLIFNFRLDVQKFDNALKDLVELYKRRFEISVQQLYDIMAAVDGDLQAMEEKYDISPVPEIILITLNARVNEEDPPKQFVGAGRKSSDEQIKRTPDQIVQSGTNSIMSICAKKEIAVAKIHAAVVKTMMEALGVQNCILFAREENQKGKGTVFNPVLGEGDMFKHVKKRTVHNPGQSNVVDICLQEKCDALVFDTAKDNVKALIPNWMTVDKINTVFIYNFHEMNPPFIVVAMRNDGQKLEMGGAMMKALTNMRTQAMKSVTPEPDEKKYVLNFKGFLDKLKKMGGG